MAAVRDFLFDANGDLWFDAGDIVVGESTLQHVRDILVAEKGDFTQFPLIGAGIFREVLNSEGEAGIRLIIQREMERDGLRVHRLRIEGGLEPGAIDLEASYA